MELRFRCPGCEGRFSVRDLTAPQWRCPRCRLEIPNAHRQSDPTLRSCLRCGNPEMYLQKVFPHSLGMAVVAVAALGFMIFHGLYWFYAAWACLFAAAGLDAALYYLMGDMAVCYRCGAEHRGFPRNPAHGAFDLGIAEKYRQERLRRQMLQQQPTGVSGPDQSQS
jgi:hypothetical protein